MTTGLGPNLNWGKTRSVTLERLDSQMEVQWIHKVEKVNLFQHIFDNVLSPWIDLCFRLAGHLEVSFGLQFGKNWPMHCNGQSKLEFFFLSNLLLREKCRTSLFHFPTLFLWRLSNTLGPCLKSDKYLFLSDETLLHKRVKIQQVENDKG